MRLLLVLPRECSFPLIITIMGLVGLQDDDEAADFVVRFFELSPDDDDDDDDDPLEDVLVSMSESDESETCFRDPGAAFPFAF